MSYIPDDANQFSEEEKLDFVLKSPTRRVFHIDVGNLPKGKAEDYIKKIMEEYREKHKND
jgi:hypothetical protein